MNVTDAKQIKVPSVIRALFLFIIIFISPSVAQESLIILNSSDVPTMLQNVRYIESLGGTITHRFPPHVLIGDVPASQRSELIGSMNIVEITTMPVYVSDVSEYGKTAEIAVDVWNNNFMGAGAEKGLTSIKLEPEPGPIVGDMLIVPEYAKSRQAEGITPQSEEITNETPVQTLPYGAGFYDISEYMIGDVAVGIIFLESNGTIDTSTEDWTTTEESNVVSEILAGLNWWIARETNSKLTFTYDIHYKVPTRYEPISRPGPTDSPNGQSLWITDAMANLGYTEYPSFFTNVYDYNNAIRTSLNTDWAFTIFVVDSSNDEDGMFADSYFAYAYLGGPFMVMTYMNNGYGIENMDAVTAHETGHIFYALDQYASSQIPCTETSGYLDIQNQNGAYPSEGACSSNVASIMRGGIPPYTGGAIDTYARQQVGWRDTDANGILDIIDFLPSSTLNAYSSDTTNNNTPIYTGRSTTTTTYPNNNPWPWNSRSAITINKITNVQYSVDGGAWINATPADGLFNSSIENFTFITSPLSAGSHTIEVRALNTGGNWETVYASDILTIDATKIFKSYLDKRLSTKYIEEHFEITNTYKSQVFFNIRYGNYLTNTRVSSANFSGFARISDLNITEYYGPLKEYELKIQKEDAQAIFKANNCTGDLTLEVGDFIRTEKEDLKGLYWRGGQPSTGPLEDRCIVNAESGAFRIEKGQINILISGKRR